MCLLVYAQMHIKPHNHIYFTPRARRTRSHITLSVSPINAWSFSDDTDWAISNGGAYRTNVIFSPERYTKKKKKENKLKRKPPI